MRTYLAIGISVFFLACGGDSTSSSGGNGASSGSLATSGGTSGPCAGMQTPRPSAGKCDVPNGCQELYRQDGQRAMSYCVDFLGGTYTGGQKCPATTIGRCMLQCKTDDEAVVFYAEGSASDLRTGCLEANGAWLGP